MQEWKPSGESSGNCNPCIDREWEQIRVDTLNNAIGNLTELECAKCLNKGYVYYLDDNCNIHSRDCECMIKRRAWQRIEKSGLKDILERYTFDRFETPEKWQQEIKSKAVSYFKNPQGWFVAAGKSGTGKTHICTAIAGKFLSQRSYDVRYMLWREDSTKIKSVITDSGEYEKLVRPLKETKVLYIDDFFKCGGASKPTAGDINLAFEILNSRYNDRSKITIISTEHDVYDIMEYDEAVGGRIYERSKEYLCRFNGKNWRTC